jgi:hypothetical protein
MEQVKMVVETKKQFSPIVVMRMKKYEWNYRYNAKLKIQSESDIYLPMISFFDEH